MPKPWPQASTKCLCKRLCGSVLKQNHNKSINMVINKALRFLPEDFFQLFDFVIWILLGAWVIQKSSRICQWSCVDLVKIRKRCWVLIISWQFIKVNLLLVLRIRHLHADAALQFELQSDHVHLTGRTQLFDLRHLLAHLIDGHLDGAQVSVVLIHHCNTLLHVREAMCGCRTNTQSEEREQLDSKFK